MSLNLDQYIAVAPDPDIAATRIDRLCGSPAAERRIAGLDGPQQEQLVSIISLSNFLFHNLVRHPDNIRLIGLTSEPQGSHFSGVTDLDSLRLYKYQELLKITWMDMSGTVDYYDVLVALSRLAVNIVQHVLRLSLEHDKYTTVVRSLSVMALGKLGAGELNYSSDIDLIFVSANPDRSISEYQELQRTLIDSIRVLNQNLQQKTVEGFLYRVDLKLRPWGRSGPLCMAVDDTENYYEASSDAWERLAWLRARLIAGSENLGNDLLQRLRPFIFLRSLSTDDLSRFVRIKNDMCKARKKHGHWDVKVGEGGIRDIEFFVQILQIVNAAGYRGLQTTSTTSALLGLKNAGLITDAEHKEIQESYLFLRRLENRLQMVDEQQTHNLPEDRNKRRVIARSMMEQNTPDSEVMGIFEEKLSSCQQIARKYFDRILPGESG